MDLKTKTEIWRSELNKAVGCRLALNNGIDIGQAIITYGFDRVALVLTHTVRNAPDASNYPSDVVDWANRQKLYKLPPGHRQGPSRFRELELDLTAITVSEMARAVMDYERTHQKSVKEFGR